MTFHKYLGDSKMFEYDKHYRECKQQNTPFIKARTNPAHGNYFVQIDLMTCDYKLTKPKQEQIKELIQVEIDYVNSNLKYVFEGFHVTPDLIWVDGISSEHIDGFCNDIYDLIQMTHN